MAKSDTSHHDERIAKMAFGSVLPHYISKIEKKGRTQEEMYSDKSQTPGQGQTVSQGW